MVSLHAVLGLQDVGIDGALGEEADLIANLAGLLLEHANELGADNLTLGLGILDVHELVQEAICGVNVNQVGIHLILEDVDDLLALALAHQAVVNMHANELLADGLDEQGRDNRTVDTTGKSQQDLFVADLLADCSDLLFDERLGKFGSGDTYHVVGTLVGIHAELLLGSMEMRRAYADAPSYDLIICRTRYVSHRCDRAFCRGGSFSISQGQLDFGSHLGSIANRLFLYTFGTIVGDTHKFQSRATRVQLLLVLPAVGRWKMDCDGYPCVPMPLMCTAFVPGQIDAAVAGIPDPDSRAIATAEALYFRGQAALAAKTAHPYLDVTDPALRYSACFICGYASLSLNRIADARRCLAGILDTPADEESPAVHATHILFASAASVLLHLPSPYSAEEFYPLAAHLPEGLRLFASYVMAHALYLRGEYGRSLGMAENALIMKQGSYPISELFLHLAASMACMSLKDIDAAKAHFGAAWDIARPDGLIELIGEHHGLLQGLIEACLKTQYPDDFARIIEITYRFSYGWRRIHNPDSGEDVADDLTTTEFTMAMLACRGWTNAEIAGHMGVSPGTVKNRLSGVYAKLGIGTRAELVAHMLR